ncbi:hypothetical protein ACYJ2U_001726 [Clostridium botulinum]|uniref:hypothetical protein n=1 Tax=Clostridium botulinum TaxID=1491 RepID=UPI0004B8C37A|nr:hypothetical protein [Clostridium botulinum]QDY27149.1 hypothetical protein CGQ40_20810 [Clostridium botulinum]
MIFKTKYDYTRHERKDVHTTIRKDMYKEFQKFCIEIDQPQTKSMDMILELVLNDEKLKNELINKIRTYY